MCAEMLSPLGLEMTELGLGQLGPSRQSPLFFSIKQASSAYHSIPWKYFLCQMLGLSTKHVLTHLIFTATLGGKYLLLSSYLFLYRKRLKHSDIKYCPRSQSIRSGSQSPNPGRINWVCVAHHSSVCLSISLSLVRLIPSTGCHVWQLSFPVCPPLVCFWYSYHSDVLKLLNKVIILSKSPSDFPSHLE